jgi:hypothetical protein
VIEMTAAVIAAAMIAVVPTWAVARGRGILSASSTRAGRLIAFPRSS